MHDGLFNGNTTAYNNVRTFTDLGTTIFSIGTAAVTTPKTPAQNINNTAGKNQYIAPKNSKLPNTKYTNSKLQHEYKHAKDFGVEGNWNKNKAVEYQNAIQNHIDTASNVYQSTYRGQDVYVYLSQDTGLGAYVDMTGNYIGGWKFSSEQINYHLTNGSKIY